GVLAGLSITDKRKPAGSRLAGRMPAPTPRNETRPLSIRILHLNHRLEQIRLRPKLRKSRRHFSERHARRDPRRRIDAAFFDHLNNAREIAPTVAARQDRQLAAVELRIVEGDAA